MKVNKKNRSVIPGFRAVYPGGVALDNDAFWSVYNYVTLVLSISSGLVLLKQR
jgi:hypothetical protein